MKTAMLLALALACCGCTTNLDPDEREFFYGRWMHPNDHFDKPEYSVERVP